MLLEVEKIKVGERIRKEMGDIDELAADIQKNSLLNPITVMPVDDGRYQLIAGERRLRACKSLGWDKILVNIISVDNARQALMMEISENENRKGFTFSERIEWARKLEEVEKARANERQGSREDIRVNLSESEKGRAAEIVADKSGFGSESTYRKAKFIAENADEELIKQLDEEQISIHGAYKRLKAENEKLEKEKERLEDSADFLKAISKEQEKDKKKLKIQLDKALKEKESLAEKIQGIENKQAEKEVVPDDYREIKSSLKDKEQHIKELKAKLASVVDADLKINTQRIEDRIRELITRQGELFEEIEFRIDEKDVDKNRIRELLFRLINSMNGIKKRAEKMIKVQDGGQVVDIF